jgi:hypothetical protein
MTSQEQANHLADGQQLGSAEDRDQACVSGPGVPSGMAFDYIDEALEETMVASDPPAPTPETGIGSPGRDADAEVDRARR